MAIILPTYRGAENVTALLNDLRQVLAGYEGAWELLVVDDYLPDGTFNRAEAVAAIDLHVRALQRHERGCATAVLHEMSKSVSDAIVVMDSDYNHSGLAGETLAVLNTVGMRALGLRRLLRPVHWLRQDRMAARPCGRPVLRPCRCGIRRGNYESRENRRAPQQRRRSPSRAKHA